MIRWIIEDALAFAAIGMFVGAFLIWADFIGGIVR